MSSSAKYLFHEGIRNVKTNKLMSFASIGVLSACLLVIGFSVLSVINLDRMVGYIGEQSSLSIFLKDGANENDVNKLKTDLENNSNVESVKYISKEQALEDYTQRLGNKDAAQTLRENNVLPASYEVSLHNLNNMNDVIEMAQKSPAFESATAPTSIAATISHLKMTIMWFGIAIVAVLVIISLVIIFNTIGTTVYARRKEIAIMKQVGATKGFIRWPFLIEGIVIGIISAVISFAILGAGYEAVKGILTNNGSAFLQSMFKSMVSFLDITIILAPSFLVGGILAGMAGSALSIRKHLRG